MHLDAAGTPDGYVAYRPGPRKDGHRAIKVSDLVALTPAAYLRLWRFLADLDLSDTVEWDRAPVDDPISWALVDPWPRPGDQADGRRCGSACSTCRRRSRRGRGAATARSSSRSPTRSATRPAGSGWSPATAWPR